MAVEMRGESTFNLLRIAERIFGIPPHDHVEVRTELQTATKIAQCERERSQMLAEIQNRERAQRGLAWEDMLPTRSECEGAP